MAGSIFGKISAIVEPKQKEITLPTHIEHQDKH